MINASITGTFPQVNNDLTSVFGEVVKVMSRSIDINLEIGGRPPWPVLKSGGETPLVGTGALKRSKRESFGMDFAEVSMGSGLGAYPFVQQFGSTHSIPITAKSRGFFWAMFHATGDEKWKFMAVTTRSSFIVHIPARPYVMFQEDDIVKILELVGKGIFRVSSPTGSASVYND